MIDLVRYGTAVANAKPKLKSVAKFETLSNSNNGVAFGLQAILKAAAKKGRVDAESVSSTTIDL